MLVTEIKAKEALPVLEGRKVFIICCRGCAEVGFPETEVKLLEKELAEKCEITGIMNAEYICNCGNIIFNEDGHDEEITQADSILVFSCGVGVQTVARYFGDKNVFAACDTFRLPGSQGVTPLEHDCRRCGECWLNLTGGICPITACSKSLLNGPCGGTKNGKCEVNPEMECGWEKIYRRLDELGKLDVLKYPTKLRDYSANK